MASWIYINNIISLITKIPIMRKQIEEEEAEEGLDKVKEADLQYFCSVFPIGNFPIQKSYYDEKYLKINKYSYS